MGYIILAASSRNARDAKSNKKGFCRYISQKIKDKESASLLIKKKGKMASEQNEQNEQCSPGGPSWDQNS